MARVCNCNARGLHDRCFVACDDIVYDIVYDIIADLFYSVATLSRVPLRWRGRRRLPNKTVTPKPPFPLDTTTDGGCDTVGTQHKAWTRQIATLQLHDSDFLISAAVSNLLSISPYRAATWAVR